jgi:hypothetical protein
LKAKCDEALSNLAFNYSLRQYAKAARERFEALRLAERERLAAIKAAAAEREAAKVRNHLIVTS